MRRWMALEQCAKSVLLRMVRKSTTVSTRTVIMVEVGSMIVTIDTIKKMFADLESGTKSREFVAEFAAAAMKADDIGSLIMEPSADASRIWKAITYLSGVDIKESPDTYLHCTEDFIEFRKEQGIPSPS